VGWIYLLRQALRLSGKGHEHSVAGAVFASRVNGATRQLDLNCCQQPLALIELRWYGSDYFREARFSIFTD